MSGTKVVILLLGFTVLFGITLYYFQVFAFYEKVNSVTQIKVLNRAVEVTNYTGIDSSTSGLKLRGCFKADPKDFSGLTLASNPTPLSAPFWFECFDNVKLQRDLNKGLLKGFMAKENEKDGIDRIVAIYPNGDGFQWRQLNAKFVD